MGWGDGQADQVGLSGPGLWSRLFLSRSGRPSASISPPDLSILLIRRIGPFAEAHGASLFSPLAKICLWQPLLRACRSARWSRARRRKNIRPPHFPPPVRGRKRRSRCLPERAFPPWAGSILDLEAPIPLFSQANRQSYPRKRDHGPYCYHPPQARGVRYLGRWARSLCHRAWTVRELTERGPSRGVSAVVSREGEIRVRRRPSGVAADAPLPAPDAMPDAPQARPASGGLGGCAHCGPRRTTARAAAWLRGAGFGSCEKVVLSRSFAERGPRSCRFAEAAPHTRQPP